MNFLKNNYPVILFFVSLLLIFLYLDYQTILFLRPQSLHFIRQTDCLSFVSTYYNMGMDFFEPRMLSLRSTDGKAIGEFPILYYLTALFYKVFGEQESILRLINILIVSTGLFFLFKLLKKIFSDTFYALTFTFLFFTSTILIYYTNNYLPDAPAFGITLIAWYYFYVSLVEERETKYYLLAISLFTLASLIKITFGLNLVAAILSFSIIKIFSEKQPLNQVNRSVIIATTVSLLVIVSWYIFVLAYNDYNNTKYFLTHIKPIWSLSSEERFLVLDYIYMYWFTKYYYESTLHVFLILTIIGYIFSKYSNKYLLVIATSTLLGSIVYFVLFYAQFKSHDYYFIALLPAIIFVVTNSFNTLRIRFPKIFKTVIIKFALLILFVLSLVYAKDKLAHRYEIAYDLYSNIGKQLDKADGYIDDMGILDNATFIVVGDKTPNGSLYFLNRRGWTIPDLSPKSLFMFKSIPLDKADFIILTDVDFAENQTIESIKKEYIGEYNKAMFYKLIH